MKTRFVKLASLLLLMFSFSVSSAQQDVTIVAPTSEVADGLDLKAVSVLFQDSENLESFERALNDSETGINNLDLNEDNEADFIRVVEQADGDARLIILQVPLAENEFQDVATIEVEKNGDDAYNMQVHGSAVIYGYDYYIAPAACPYSCLADYQLDVWTALQSVPLRFQNWILSTLVPALPSRQSARLPHPDSQVYQPDDVCG